MDCTEMDFEAEHFLSQAEMRVVTTKLEASQLCYSKCAFVLLTVIYTIFFSLKV